MDIFLRKELKGHTDYVLAVDFDENYIVSGSADKTIKVCVGEGRRRRRRGSSVHPKSSCFNFLRINSCY